MPIFSSPRERRLWLLTALLVLTIFATLGLARLAADWLVNNNLLNGAFILGCLLVLATVLTQGLRHWPNRYEWLIGLGITAVYLLLFVRIALPTERSHLIEYGVVAVFIYEALSERKKQGRRVPAPALLAAILTTLVGAIDEAIQLFLPRRFFSWEDILFNALAAVMAMGAVWLLAWARR